MITFFLVMAVIVLLVSNVGLWVSAGTRIGGYERQLEEYAELRRLVKPLALRLRREVESHSEAVAAGRIPAVPNVSVVVPVTIPDAMTILRATGLDEGLGKEKAHDGMELVN